MSPAVAVDESGTAGNGDKGMMDDEINGVEQAMDTGKVEQQQLGKTAGIDAPSCDVPDHSVEFRKQGKSRCYERALYARCSPIWESKHVCEEKTAEAEERSMACSSSVGMKDATEAMKRKVEERLFSALYVMNQH